MELPKEGARIQAQALAQLGSRQPGRRLEDQGDNRLGQMAMAGKTDVPMEPKALLVELGQFGQGVEAAIVIETGQSAPALKPAPDSPEGAFEFLLDFSQGDDLFSAPAAEEGGGRILDPFHGKRGDLELNGTLYEES